MEEGSAEWQDQAYPSRGSDFNHPQKEATWTTPYAAISTTQVTKAMAEAFYQKALWLSLLV